MNPTKVLLADALLVDPSAGIHGRRDILVSRGRIEAVAPSLAPFQQWLEDESESLIVLDLQGRYVFPGLVDIHTHLRVPGQEYKEDLISGTEAAAWGGFTTILAMPNTRPCVDRVSVLRALRERVTREASVRVEIVGALTIGQKGKSPVSFRAMREQGAVAFSDDGRPVMDAAVARASMIACRDLFCPVVSHCEDLKLAGDGILHDGKVARDLGIPGIPSSSEEVMVARDILLARETGAHVHLAHLSTAGSMEMVRIAKEKGISVTAEVTPHHLTLTEESVRRFGSDAKVNPPLRSWFDVEALRAGVNDGIVDAVASDHAPHHPDEKALSLREAPFGVIGLETTLPVMMDLVAKGIFGVERVVDLLSRGPSRVMGLDGGALRPGDRADLVVVEPDRIHTVDVRRFRSKAENCPFRGSRLKGKPVLTMVGGDILMKEERHLKAGRLWKEGPQRGR